MTMHSSIFDKPAILTCAVTGEGPLNPKHPNFPVTPEQICAAVVEAAEAGASMVHCHVREPDTGKGSHDPALYRELMDRIRASGVDVVINFTAGGNADFVPEPFDSANPGPASTAGSVETRLRHVIECRPEVASLDVTTMNDGDIVYLNTAPTLRGMAEGFKAHGVKPEIEVFGPGDIEFAKDMIARGIVAPPPLFQFVLGVRWGMPANAETVMYMKSQLPADAVWGMLGIGSMQMPVAALSAVLGGNVRVGLEDNLYLEKGVFATNGQLVTRAKSIIENVGRRVATPDEARAIMGIAKR
ncbi:MAG: 3-keto-5-aminohexanoate cleavage protein [Sphingorhabdus sp.]